MRVSFSAIYPKKLDAAETMLLQAENMADLFKRVAQEEIKGEAISDEEAKALYEKTKDKLKKALNLGENAIRKLLQKSYNLPEATSNKISSHATVNFLELPISLPPNSKPTKSYLLTGEDMKALEEFIQSRLKK